MPDPTPKAAATATAPLPVVDRFLQQGKIIRDDSQRQFALALLSEYATQVLDQGMTVDNIEGVAVAPRPGGVQRFYLISDDNFASNQRTLLMAFDWTRPPAKEPAR